MPLKPWPATATLTAAVCLVLLMAAASLSVTRVRDGQSALSRYQRHTVENAAIRRHLEAVLALRSPLTDDLPEAPAGATVRREDLSGRIDISTAPAALLLAPELQGWFIQGGPQGWLQARTETPGTLPKLESWVTPEALSKVLDQAPVNLNAVDPAAWSGAAGIRIENTAESSSMAAQLAARQSQNILMSQADEDFLLGRWSAKLRPWVTDAPLWNAQMLPSEVWEALIVHGPFVFSNALTKARLLQQEAAAGGLTEKRIAAILEVPAKHRIFAFLGTRSRVGALTYQTSNSVWRARFIDVGTESDPEWRVTEWRRIGA